jgi:hypothetical protein
MFEIEIIEKNISPDEKVGIFQFCKTNSPVKLTFDGAALFCILGAELHLAQL